MSVSEIQQWLADHGYNPGVIDGKMGPNTKAAIRAYQADVGLSADGIAGKLTQGAMREGRVKAGVGPAAAAPAAPGAPADTYQQKYPQFAWAFNDPEVRAKLEEGAAQRWGPDELQGEIQKTNWWKTKTDRERGWLQQIATNPEQASEDLGAYDAANKFMAFANQYGIGYVFDDALKQVQRIVRGEQTAEALRQEIINQSKALYPWLAKSLDAGGTVEQTMTTYRDLISRTLGMAPEQILTHDPKWLSLMQGRDKDGKPTGALADVTEVEARLKLDPQYGFRGTKGGREQASAGVHTTREIFGAA